MIIISYLSTVAYYSTAPDRLSGTHDAPVAWVMLGPVLAFGGRGSDTLPPKPKPQPAKAILCSPWVGSVTSAGRAPQLWFSLPGRLGFVTLGRGMARLAMRIHARLNSEVRSSSLRVGEPGSQVQICA